MTIKRWWKYAVLRGPGVPAHLDGMWYDMRDMLVDNGPLPFDGPHATFEPTDQWEQRSDGEVAVVYRCQWKP